MSFAELATKRSSPERLKVFLVGKKENATRWSGVH
jgi:hypothetical protein